MRSPPPSRKEGAAAEGPRRKEAGRGKAVGKLKKSAENAGAKGAGGVTRSSVPTVRTGVARNGATGVGSGAGAQQAVPPQEQQRHGVGARAWPEIVGSVPVAVPGDAITACTRKARSRTRAWKDRVTVGELRIELFLGRFVELLGELRRVFLEVLKAALAAEHVLATVGDGTHGLVVLELFA